MQFDSPEWRTRRNALLLDWMRGDHAAVEFLLTVFELGETWDDLIDGDAVEARSIHRAFVSALFDLPANPFYARHQEVLRPLMLVGVNAWMDSVALEHAEDDWSLLWAYALRDWYMELVAFCALLVGGFEHMRAVSLPARRFFQAETFEQFRAGKR
jgi:hypothetical protein